MRFSTPILLVSTLPAIGLLPNTATSSPILNNRQSDSTTGIYLVNPLWDSYTVFLFDDTSIDETCEADNLHGHRAGSITAWAFTYSGATGAFMAFNVQLTCRAMKVMNAIMAASTGEDLSPDCYKKPEILQPNSRVPASIESNA